MEDKNLHVVLEFPENLKEQVGKGSLMVQLEVNTREEEGWLEEVSFQEGYMSRFYAEKKTWAEAEAYCQEEGGHLASVLSEDEQQEVEALAEGPVWLGATDKEREGVWQWTDGSLWNYTKWVLTDATSGKRAGDRGTDNNCAIMLGSNKDWSDWYCTRQYSFICQLLPHKIRGNSYRTMRYNRKEITFKSLTVEYSY